jgi:predicted nucleotidyltransferase
MGQDLPHLRQRIERSSELLQVGDWGRLCSGEIFDRVREVRVQGEALRRGLGIQGRLDFRFDFQPDSHNGLYSLHQLSRARQRFGRQQYASRRRQGVADPTVADAIRGQREEIIRIAGSHGATEVRLIGSIARGEARPESDVDLLVTWSEGTSLLDQAALMLELEKLLGRKVDIASDGWVKPSIRESVYRDAITL